MAVWGGGVVGVMSAYWFGGGDTSNRDGQSILGYGKSTRYFKGEAYAQTSQQQLAAQSVSRGPNRRFSFVALAGKMAHK